MRPTKPTLNPKSYTNEGRGSSQNSQLPNTIQMDTASRIMTVIPREMDSYPLMRKPLAMSVMKNTRTKLWERSLRVGKLRSPCAQLQRYRNILASVMCRPHIMSGRKLLIASLMEMKQKPYET